MLLCCMLPRWSAGCRLPTQPLLAGRCAERERGLRQGEKELKSRGTALDKQAAKLAVQQQELAQQAADLAQQRREVEGIEARVQQREEVGGWVGKLSGDAWLAGGGWGLASTCSAGDWYCFLGFRVAWLLLPTHAWLAALALAGATASAGGGVPPRGRAHRGSWRGCGGGRGGRRAQGTPQPRART